MEDERTPASGSVRSRTGLRLVWFNPLAPERPPETRVELWLVPPPAIPSRPVNLALAIERHLSGQDGLTREQFVLVFSGSAASAGQR